MALRKPLVDGIKTQGFGPSAISIEPSMWYSATRKAFWQWYPGGTFGRDVHAGVDFAGKPAGTNLVAAESGVVTKSYYDAINGGGNVVEVEIRPGTRYSYNHCQSRKVGVGHVVSKGDVIATVGATGTIWTGTMYVRSAYGVHCHTCLIITEKGSDGVTRDMLYDFSDFMTGGKLANDSRIQPSRGSGYPTVEINPDVNIRTTPDLDVGSTNIAYVSRSTGIFTVKGVKVANAGADFQLRSHVTNDDGGWGHLYKFNRHLYVKDGLYK